MSLHRSYIAEEASRPKSTYSSHDTQQTTVAIASRTNKRILRPIKQQVRGENIPVASRNRLVAPSSAFPHNFSAGKTTESGARRGNVKDVPPILPRSVSDTYTSCLDISASSRTVFPSPVPLGGSRIPVPSGPPNENALGLGGARKTLRRKAPSVERYVSGLDRSGSEPNLCEDPRGDRVAKRSSKSLPEGFRETKPGALSGTVPSAPNSSTMLRQRRSGDLPPALIPELKALAAATASNRTLSSTPQVPSVSSPSTQYSGSTGLWSSRDTTPTSISSCSPGIIQPVRAKKASKIRKAVPSTHIAEESVHSGYRTPFALGKALSSSSVDNVSESGIDRDFLLDQYRKRQARKSQNPPAPTPPPRKSSVNPKAPPRKASHKGSEVSLLDHRAAEKGIVEPLKERKTDDPAPVEDILAREVPRRPSRKGIADLDMNVSSIVQSNLSAQSIRGYRRRDSVDIHNFSKFAQDMALAGGRKAEAVEDRPPPVEGSRRPVFQERLNSLSHSSRQPVTSRNPDSSQYVAAKDSSVRGTNESGRSTMGKLSSRLGLFGRRPKVSPEDTAIQENRDLRKGPAAGTGHEGYGKYARRGRKHSVGSANSSRERSTSTASRPPLRRKNSLSSAGGSDIDDFIAQRLQPVIIPGGGGCETRPVSDAPTDWPSLHRTSLSSDASAYLTRQHSNEPPRSIVSDSWSLSVTSLATDAPSSIAADSMPTSFSQAFPNQHYPAHAPPSLDGYSTSQSSLIQDDVPVVSADRSLAHISSRDLKRVSKAGRTFKWNFFRRKASTGELVRQIEQQGQKSIGMSVAVAPVPVDKPIPYYAMVDSEIENDGEDVLQNLLEQVYESPTSSDEPSYEPLGLGLRQQYGQSVLLPSMPALQQEDPRYGRPRSPPLVEEYKIPPAEPVGSKSQQSPDTKRHRLPQVGRIPRVISRRERQHKPAPTSFSRPFQREDFIHAPKRIDAYAASVADSKRPVLGIQTDVLPSRPFSSPQSGQAASAPAGPASSLLLRDHEPHPDCVVFSSKGGPHRLDSGNSDSAFSVAGRRPTAAHRYHTEEDEIWNEYDDLLDHVMSPTSPDAGHPVPSSLSQPISHTTPPQWGQARPKSHLRSRMMHQPTNNAYAINAPSLNILQSSSSTEAGAEYRLRRSRIVSALRSSCSPLSPSSPFTANDRNLGYSDHNFSGTDFNQQSSDARTAQRPLPSPAPYPTLSKLPEVSHQQSTALLDVAERNREGPAGQSDLRFAALMTSRWLSFGRVLFSPAQEVVEAGTEQQILVIDGLGNDDWSFFCAVTYPGAVVHDLKETDVAVGSRREPPHDPRRAPPNYRRVELPSLAERFPFPPSFFAVVVLRFPAAMPETILRMALAECKRVLVPGGHLELSLLDLDIANMGTVTRHAVRDLKARMIGADPDVSLKPVSDNIQNILGQRGFVNLNRCVVGVPVAGKVATSSGSRSSRSSRESSSQKSRELEQDLSSSAGRNGREKDSERQRQRGGSFSLTELVSDHSARSDEKITKMVAKVGRWWYTRTYEWAVLPGGDLKKSIWSNKKVLHECKVRGSDFKLLIAYAQKPVEMRRRTLSEPARGTAAVAGTRVMKHYNGVY